VTSGAGDLVLIFSGHPGSGFEQCDITTQSLTRGSQYQTSFLPEMKNGQDYNVKVHASFKDFNPINFDLKVKYNPDLDGHMKFIDLGTHIFYKNSSIAAFNLNDYKFRLSSVLNEEDTDDDQSNYHVIFNDGLSDYFEIGDQSNNIALLSDEFRQQVSPGENIVKVTEDGEGDFLNSDKKFYALPGLPNKIEIPLVSELKDGELAVVLTWMQGS